MSLQPKLQIVKYPGRCLVHKIRDCDSIVFKDLPVFLGLQGCSVWVNAD